MEEIKVGLAVKMVAAFFDAKKINYDVADEHTIVTGYNFDGGSMKIFIQFDEEETGVHVEGWNFINIPKSKYDIMYRIVNALNDQYKHFKFVLDEKRGEISVSDDDIVSLDTCADEVFTLVQAMVAVVENAYPILMKALWA